MMYQMKRVNDWLDETLKKEKRQIDSKEDSTPGDDELLRTYKRVKNKNYGIILKFIERTAMALES